MPLQIRKAYGLDQLSYTGIGQIIAIIDSYGCHDTKRPHCV
jgi:hypothetical protein